MEGMTTQTDIPYDSRTHMRDRSWKSVWFKAGDGDAWKYTRTINYGLADAVAALGQGT